MTVTPTQLPPYVNREKGKGTCFRPYLGRKEGRIQWGKRIKLAPYDADLAFIWAEYNKLDVKPRESKANPWRRAYNTQRKKARARGITWEFTFDEWLEWWGDDITKRGNKKGELCMARYNDTGPYAEWNVRKCTTECNAREREARRIKRGWLGGCGGLVWLDREGVLPRSNWVQSDRLSASIQTTRAG